MNVNSPAYVSFYRWATSEQSGVSALFPATLLLYERLRNDPELVEQIIRFWSGERIPIADVRRGLKQIGESTAFPIRATPVRQLATERFVFLSRLVRGAGYEGWVLLIDEAELMGRYSVLQRGRAYAEFARWMGQTDDSFLGVGAVITITDDYALHVLAEKGDRDIIGPKLRSKGTDEYAVVAGRAETGMRAIEREAVLLTPPDDVALQDTFERLRDIHGRAYAWKPPQIARGSISTTARMRSYVRRWITEWDLKRLYPAHDTVIVEDALHTSFDEDRELERESEGTETDLEGDN